MTRNENDQDDGDDLAPARGIWTGTVFSAALLLALGGWLWGCAPANTQSGVDAAKVSLASAEKAGIYYITQPLCGRAHPKPRCSEAMKSAEIKLADQAAYDAVKGAEMTGDKASLDAANAAIARLDRLIPKPGV